MQFCCSSYLTKFNVVICCYRYYQTTSDVLTSVRKMEESLKRLKRKGSRAGVGGGMSDDDKIRLQLLIDVQNYGQQVSANPDKFLNSYQ